LEAVLKKELGAEVELIKGRGGIFDVVAGGKPVYSKHATGRFPEENEVVEAIRALK
jgi:selT/selW/selH-like putative selenoprotein